MSDAQTQTPITAMRGTQATNAQPTDKPIITAQNTQTQNSEHYTMPVSLGQTPKQHVQDNMI
jgi:hypothetical protein